MVFFIFIPHSLTKTREHQASAWKHKNSKAGIEKRIDESDERYEVREIDDHYSVPGRMMMDDDDDDDDSLHEDKKNAST